MALYADRDRDGRGAGALVHLCVAQRPVGYANVAGDCDDDDRLTHTLVPGYLDTDRDGYGVLPQVSVCTGGSLPVGYSSQFGDCAPDDPLLFLRMTYGFVDRDRDGFTVPESGSMCTNGTLPPPYHATASRLDCDDGDRLLTHNEILFADVDGDGVGAGPRSVQCLGASLPAGMSLYGDDVDDVDEERWEDDEDDDLIDLLFF
jgi:hypothetical protein